MSETKVPQLKHLDVSSFPNQTVKLLFEDDSECTFKHSFIKREKGPYRNQPKSSLYLVVYTEHTGYHVFPFESVQSLALIRREAMTNHTLTISINEDVLMMFFDILQGEL